MHAAPPPESLSLSQFSILLLCQMHSYQQQSKWQHLAADSLVPDPKDRKSDTDPPVAEPISVPVRGVDTDPVLVD